MSEHNHKKIVIGLKWLNGKPPPGIAIPDYETAGASGMDVCAAIEQDMHLSPGDIKLVATGFALDIPEGFEIQVRPRSGLAIKHGITIVNAPGTIDSDYRGEVKIGLINVGTMPFTIKRGDRIAQLVASPVVRAEILVMEELTRSDRDDGGFGHTGIR